MANKQGVFEEKAEEYWEATKKRRGKILRAGSQKTSRPETRRGSAQG